MAHNSQNPSGLAGGNTLSQSNVGGGGKLHSYADPRRADKTKPAAISRRVV